MDTLSEGRIEAVLRNAGFGFLGLAHDNRPYVLPMSFGYDGDALYFQMNSRGRKFEYLGENPAASFAVLEVDYEADTTESVLVEGELNVISEDEAETALEALAANAYFGTTLDVWGVSLQEADLTLLKLSPNTITGRVFGENAV